jgi:serine protease Do
MYRVIPMIALPVLLALAVPARAADKPAAELAALEKAIQQVIDEAEPSIACILVSRSDGYGQFGAVPSEDKVSGKLGGFEAERFLRAAAEARDEKRRRQILQFDLSNPATVPESYGSGVVIDDKQDLVLTCAHVVRNATKIYVRLPGGRGSWADIHASDPRSDLAVLRLLDRVPDLKALKMIDFKGRKRDDENVVRKGQFVVSLANPYAAGFRDGSPSASWGIVSNLRRRAPGSPNELDRARETLHHYGTLIQPDTRLNLGCSGGALLNLQGELVGLTTATAAIGGSDVPGGFAVPLDARMQRILAVLREGKEVEYGFLGVQLERDGRPGDGSKVVELANGSPAQRANLPTNQFIVKVNGVPVRDNDDLFLLVGTQLAGSPVEVEMARTPGGTGQTYTVTLAKFYVPGPVIASNRPLPRGGLRVDYASILSQRDPLPPRWARHVPDGVLITEVQPGSAAEAAKLQVDKIIAQVNGKPVKTPADFYREMDSAARSPNRTAKLTLLTADGREDPLPAIIEWK